MVNVGTYTSPMDPMGIGPPLGYRETGINCRGPAVHQFLFCFAPKKIAHIKKVSSPRPMGIPKRHPVIREKIGKPYMLTRGNSG